MSGHITLLCATLSNSSAAMVVRCCAASTATGHASAESALQRLSSIDEDKQQLGNSYIRVC
jgi:hypothetical protein